MIEVAAYIFASYSVVLSTVFIAYFNVGRLKWVKIIMGVLAAVSLPLGILGALGLVGYLALNDSSLPLFSFVGFGIFQIVVSLLVLVAVLSRSPSSAGHRRFRSGLLVAVLFLLPLLPYAFVEVQTHAFASSMIPAARQGLKEDGWFSEPDVVRFKVLLVTRRSATVYVVSRLHPGSPKSGLYADMLQLVRTRKGWMYKPSSESIVWSDAGSARAVVFPLYAPGRGDR